MKADRRTASRYAKALYAVAKDEGAVEAIGRELGEALRAVSSSPELRTVLARPWIKPAERRAVAMAVAQRAGCGKRVQDFLGLVAARGRASHLGDIVAEYHALVDASFGRVRAEVRTRVPLSDEQRQRVAARLGGAVGKQVLLEETVDASLLGGFVARVGSLVVDGSLDGQLARMRERLARG
jgi:F-type H+-transporting ATPase subunit delta